MGTGYSQENNLAKISLIKIKLGKNMFVEKIFDNLDNISQKLAKLIGYICCFLLLIIAVSVVIQVVFRETNIPVVWLGELSTYCSIWVTFLGMALGYRENMLARVDLLYHFMSSKGKKIIEILWEIIIITIVTIIIWSSRLYILHVFRSNTKSPELSVPLWTMYLGPVVGYIFVLFFALIKVYRIIMNFNRKLIEGGSKC